MPQIPLVVEKFVSRTILFAFISLFVLAAALIVFFEDLYKKIFFRSEVEPHGKAVFITGCDTGFGHALAKRLDSKGFQVFASCLFPAGEGASKLKATCSGRLRTLPLDVKRDESVENAVKFVKENLGSSELWAVVNNAGILKGFSVEMSTMDEFKDVLDVNFLGTVRVTKAFLPLLKKSKGRIVNVTSIGGEISLPFGAPYLSSKYAAVGFTDCLRHEINNEGISVVSIEPELFYTPMADIANQSLNVKLLDKDDYEKSLKDLYKVVISIACHDTGIVVDDMELAVVLEHPDHTYKPRRHALARFICFAYEVMPRSLRIFTVKIVLFVFFSESKMMKNCVMKIIAAIVK